MSLASLNPSLKRGSHPAVVIEVVSLSPAHFRHEVRIDLGPQVVCDNALVVDIIPLQNACLLQFVERGDDLLKRTVDDSPRLKNFGFGFVQFLQFFQLALFHCLYPIGNHVSQRIQAFSRDGKRGYLHSLRKKITETQTPKGLDAGVHGGPYRNRQSAHLQSRNRKERSRVARSGNIGRQLWGLIASAFKQVIEGSSNGATNTLLY